MVLCFLKLVVEKLYYYAFLFVCMSVTELERVIFAIELRIFMLKYGRVRYANEFRLYERNFSSARLIEL